MSDFFKVREIRHTACSTHYKVNDTHEIELGMIVGGIPALWMVGAPFHQRYPIIKRWKTGHWIKDMGIYDHQREEVRGPSVDEVLPLGWVTFFEFYKTNLPKFKLAWERYEQLKTLPSWLLVSQRFHDVEEHTYCHAHLTQSHWSHVPHASFSCPAYCGSIVHMGVKRAYLNDTWKTLAIVLTIIGKKFTLDQLSTEEFAMLKEEIRCLKR
jgi:hypothetical protein